MSMFMVMLTGVEYERGTVVEKCSDGYSLSLSCVPFFPVLFSIEI
jgi:hypothetical protein